MVCFLAVNSIIIPWFRMSFPCVHNLLFLLGFVTFSCVTFSSLSASAKRRGFDFSLSFQQGYGIYKISHENHCHHHHSSDGQPAYCPSPVSASGGGPEVAAFSTRAAVDSAQPPPATPARLEQPVAGDGPERRLSHEETRKPDLTDWEWSRSKSERTPRQVLLCGASFPHGGSRVCLPVLCVVGVQCELC